MKTKIMSAASSKSRNGDRVEYWGNIALNVKMPPKGDDDEDRLVADMIELARHFGRYGYQGIAALLREAGWSVSDGLIGRLLRRNELNIPKKQPKKGRLWLNDGSCMRLRPEYRNNPQCCRLKPSRLFCGDITLAKIHI